MKKKKYIILLLILAALLACAALLYPGLSGNHEGDSQNSAPFSGPASDFTVYDADGNAVSLSEQQGTPVVINFWATWCGYCMDELPAFHDMAEKYGENVRFMMVDLADGSRETPEQAKEFVEENGFTFPVYFDNDQSAVKAYGINSIPLTLFIDAQGNVVHSQIGAMDENALEESILSLVNGKASKTAAPKQEAGCSFH